MATSSRKSTDLERLTQPGGKVMPDDATIPVLTERLTLPSLDLDISLPKPPPPVVAPGMSSPTPGRRAVDAKTGGRCAGTIATPGATRARATPIDAVCFSGVGCARVLALTSRSSGSTTSH